MPGTRFFWLNPSHHPVFIRVLSRDSRAKSRAGIIDALRLRFGQAAGLCGGFFPAFEDEEGGSGEGEEGVGGGFGDGGEGDEFAGVVVLAGEVLAAGGVVVVNRPCGEAGDEGDVVADGCAVGEEAAVPVSAVVDEGEFCAFVKGGVGGGDVVQGEGDEGGEFEVAGDHLEVGSGGGGDAGIHLVGVG